MARKLDTPKTVPTTHQVIDEWTITVVRNADLSVNTSQTNLFYIVLDLNSDGLEVRRADRRVVANDWPPTFLAEIKSAHKKIMADATNQGLIGAGTDTEEYSTRSASGAGTIGKITSAGAGAINP